MTEDQGHVCMGKLAERYANCLKNLALMRSHLKTSGDVLVNVGQSLQKDDAPDEVFGYPSSEDVCEDIDRLRERLEEKATLEKSLTEMGLAALIRD